MTPKEKAKDLIRKFYSIGAIECKQCALIAVELMIYHTEEDSSNIDLYQFYLEVKHEIEKL
jgi:hypothetical protein